MILTIVLITFVIVLLALILYIAHIIYRIIAPRLSSVFQRDLVLCMGGLVVIGIIIGLLSAKILIG